MRKTLTMQLSEEELTILIDAMRVRFHCLYKLGHQHDKKVAHRDLVGKLTTLKVNHVE